MDVEIIYTGLCVFLNLEKKNATMGDPSVILVRTDHHRHDHPETHSHQPWTPLPDAQTEHEHIPFLAYDKSTTEVISGKDADWQPIADTNYLYVPLSGVELSIAEDDRKGPFVVDGSYDNKVVKKDDYWPAAKDQWNRAYVPERSNKPKSMVVAGFMRFHTGHIRAGKTTNQEWKFKVDGKSSSVHQQRFAFDVVYSKVPHGEGRITILETCLECGHLKHSHKFHPKVSGEKVTLFVGNNMQHDMKYAVMRRQAPNPAIGKHFVFINKIADATMGLGDGPIPEPDIPVIEGGIPNEEESSGTDGYCGPANGND